MAKVAAWRIRLAALENLQAMSRQPKARVVCLHQLETDEQRQVVALVGDARVSSGHREVTLRKAKQRQLSVCQREGHDEAYPARAMRSMTNRTFGGLPKRCHEKGESPLSIPAAAFRRRRPPSTPISAVDARSTAAGGVSLPLGRRRTSWDVSSSLPTPDAAAFLIPRMGRAQSRRVHDRSASRGRDARGRRPTSTAVAPIPDSANGSPSESRRRDETRSH